MQTVSDDFVAASLAPVRSPQTQATFDWNRDGSPEDDTQYVQSIQVDRFFDQPSSVARAAVDVVLNNTTKRFNPDSGSPVAGLVSVGAPVHVKFGFGGELISLFDGVISDYPTFDTVARTVEIFGFDPVDSLGQQLTVSDITGTNKKVDWVLTQVMTQLGYSSGAYSFGTGVTVIPTVDIPAGTDVATLIKDLMIAEVGLFWADETGLFRFQPRNTNPYPTAFVELTDDMLINSQDLITTYLINTCQITGPGGTTATYTDSGSVAIYGPQLLQINNPFIQNDTLALDLATYYVQSNSSQEAFHVNTIRAFPQMQLGDFIIWRSFTYQIVRTKTKYDPQGGFTQDYTLKRFNGTDLFTIAVSQIGGTDVIAP